MLAEEVSRLFDVAYQQDDQETVPLTGCGPGPLEARRLEVGDWSGSVLVERLTQMAAEPASRESIC